MLRTRRRSRYGAQVLCAIISALLLLLSVTVLHSRLGTSNQSSSSKPNQYQSIDLFTAQDSIDDLDTNPLLEDVINNEGLSVNSNNKQKNDDLIDEFDNVEEENSVSRISDEEEILRGLEDDSVTDLRGKSRRGGDSDSEYYWDHVVGVRRRAFNKQLIDPWEDYGSLEGEGEDRSRVAFASDDQPVNEDVRGKFDGIKGIEDALLLKTGKRNSALREGWATWFEKKGDFLRRDKMFRSNLEVLNPMNNPLLQDPDSVGLTVLTRGDKIMQKTMVSEVQKSQSVGKKPFGVHVNVDDIRFGNMVSGSGNEVKRMERRTLDDNGSVSVSVNSKDTVSSSESLKLSKAEEADDGNLPTDVLSKRNVSYDERGNKRTVGLDNVKGQQNKLKAHIRSEYLDHIYADGKRWGYFPGLYSHLSFSEFMEEFFKQGKCSMRAFMVWNSSPWMYTVRHQRGLESLLYHHPDACVVVFSETIELDFFKDFVKDGFKVAVAMPNLDELLKDTPTHVFASVWYEWKKTKFYPFHYSELVRLAALYKYGGLYLDSDIIVLKPMSSLNNSFGAEDDQANSSFNGAVMVFKKNSSFVMECLREFYSSYDDTLLRWNGAELLTRTAKRFWSHENNSDKHLELKIQPSSMFFPISPEDIIRYFAAPADETSRAQQYVLLLKILDGSYTFHFWNGITSALVPEPDSLVAKLLNHHCIHCLDVL